jgi:hypothetical protein
MTTTDTEATNVIQIEVLVPVSIPDQERARFEQAMVAFIFGADRVRPELREDLAAAGVDFNHLAALSQNPRIGVCPSPGALEFIPSDHLVEVCKRHGIDLTSGGSVLVGFTYDAYTDSPAPSDQLEVNLKLPGAVRLEAADASDLTADIVRALFGDCQLAATAQAYLRAHGVDLTEVAARNVDRLGGSEVPFTTRVNPDVHRYLSERGFNIDQFGRFGVNSIDQIGDQIGTLPDGLAWSKTTCC